MLNCPVCKSSHCERVLQDYTVQIKRNGTADIGGLAIYMCPAGHIFLLRSCDTESGTSANAA